MDNVDDIYPLTPSQAGILYHVLRDQDPALYFEQVRADLSGELDVERLRRTWDEAFARHPALRTMFVWHELDDPLQVVRSGVEVPWRFLDVRDENDPAGAVEAICAEERATGFDLARAPLSRMVLVRTGDDAWHFVWNFHHIVLDGWSTVAVFEEVFAAYADPTTVPAAPRPFRDHVAWLAGHDRAGDEAHWRARLGGFEAPTPLRFGRVTESSGFELGSIDIDVDDEATATIAGFARANRVTMNTVVQAAWATVLSRYSGEDDVVFGVTMSGRPPELDGVEEMVGMFLTTLPMRLEVPGTGTVTDWLPDVLAQQLELLDQQHTSLADVTRWSDLRPGDALFDTILVFENYPRGQVAGTDRLTVERRAVFEQSHYGLTVMVKPGARLGFTVLFDRSRFSEDEVGAMFGHLVAAMTDMTRGDVTPRHVEILTAPERRRMLEEWNDTATDWGLGPAALDTTLTDLFADQVAARPDDVALVQGTETMTYRELAGRANRLAHRLQAMGVGPEVPVGVCTNRSFEMVTAVLGVLGAGGAYVPLDPTYPADRIALIAADAGLDVIVTNEASRRSVPDVAARVVDAGDDLTGVHPDHPPVAGSTPDTTAFITFTSGSTGRPKGVQGHHRGIVNRIRWQWHAYPLEPGELVAQKTTLNFADHLWELWGALLSGHAQVLVPEDVVLDTPRFLEMLARHRIRRVVLVPSYIRALLDAHADLAARLPDLTWWTFSGEGVSRALADRFRREVPHGVLLNFYGMSEVTLDAATYDDRWGVDCDTVPIGRPIDNMAVYVLDQHLRPAPVGVTGQIHASGVGLSRGYWRRDDLTAERFVPHPFRPGERLYATGDLGRWLPEGQLEYLGRADHQVKIRGMRIELGEIEAVVAADVRVSDCVVLKTVDERDERLVAYVIPMEGHDLDAQTVRDIAAAQLPAYMVPTAVVTLDAYPTTPNGKVDRRALPDPVFEGTADEVDEESLSEPERSMLAIWRDVLGPWVGPDDDFFDVGGHSLLALRLVGRVAKDLGSEVPLATFFDAPTPRALAAHLQAPHPDRTWQHLVPIAEGRSDRPPIYCVHGAGGNVMNLNDLGRHLEGSWTWIGIQAAGVDGVAAPHGSIDEYCDAYLGEILEHQPEGPYLLAGYSAGGVVAYEMARRLEAMGRDVVVVGLLDTVNPAVRRSSMPTLRRLLRLARGGVPLLVERVQELARRRAKRVAYTGSSEVTQQAVPLELRGEHLTRNMASIISAHRTEPYDGTVVMFAAEHIDWAYERGGPARGWDRVTTDLRLCLVPGRHTDIVLGEHAAELARAMVDELDALWSAWVSRRGDEAAA